VQWERVLAGSPLLRVTCPPFSQTMAAFRMSPFPLARQSTELEELSPIAGQRSARSLQEARPGIAK
jgi:hypothetical protein